jgi:transglutaminase-like putative cysteine protease
LPLTVVLFVFFPRVAPLWTVPLPGGAKTGISDRMTPGDVAELAQSDALAFRVVFDGEVPAYESLYWRGLVYSAFDDGTWSVRPSRTIAVSRPDQSGDPISYEVLMDPTLRDWLFALDRAVPMTSGVSLTADYRLTADDPVLSVFRYRVQSWPGASMDVAGIGDGMRIRETEYPPHDNPRIQAYAASVWARTGTVRSFVEEVLGEIRSQEYHYTLKPPLLDEQDSIDMFWFDTRRGFCTHYAGALVFMLRAIGVPARMVGGYQGGAINPITGHLMVRQYDAHAWVEAYTEGDGWLRVDPTQAVAPARIQLGIDAALSPEDRSELSALSSARLGDWTVVSSLLAWGDSLEHRWNLWVIGFDSTSQRGFLTRLLGDLTPARVGLTMLAFGALSLSVVALMLFWRRGVVRRHPVERMFRSFTAGAARHGFERAPGESPMAFLDRVGRHAKVNDAQLELVVAHVEALLYNPGVVWGARELRYLRAQLRRLRFRLAFHSSH